MPILPEGPQDQITALLRQISVILEVKGNANVSSTASTSDTDIVRSPIDKTRAIFLTLSQSVSQVTDLTQIVVEDVRRSPATRVGALQALQTHPEYEDQVSSPNQVYSPDQFYSPDQLYPPGQAYPPVQVYSSREGYAGSENL